MKTLFLVLALLLQNENPPLFQTVVKNAKSENKPILLIFSGSDWCANCIKLKTNVFDQEAFKTLQAEKFEMYTADFPRGVDHFGSPCFGYIIPPNPAPICRAKIRDGVPEFTSTRIVLPVVGQSQLQRFLSTRKTQFWPV